MTSETPVIRIGTRASKLALAQAETVRDLLGAHYPELRFQLVPMTTTGDHITDRTLADIGGKGLFAKELDDALISGSIDLSVHSAKDLESFINREILIASTLMREDNKDGFIGLEATRFRELPPGATLGTASARRTAQALRLRPDLRIVPLRGNVPTRIEKIRRAEAEGTFLALAGLKRLRLEAEATEILDRKDFLPAACQGIIAITCRAGDEATHALLAPLNHAASFAAAAAERALLAALDGSCHTPIAAWAREENGAFLLSGALYAADGSEHYAVERLGSAADARVMGEDAGAELKALGGHLLP